MILHSLKQMSVQLKTKSEHTNITMFNTSEIENCLIDLFNLQGEASLWNLCSNSFFCLCYSGKKMHIKRQMCMSQDGLETFCDSQV